MTSITSKSSRGSKSESVWRFARARDLVQPAVSTPALHAQGLSRRFGVGARAQSILKGVDLRVSPGEMVAIVGASGSGKSTLLNLLGALDRPDAGQVWIGGIDPWGMTDRARSRLRASTIGFVFQAFLAHR